MHNYIFASVFANYTGYNVSIIEVDNINNDGKFKLIQSVNSDRLSIEDIADIIRSVIPLEIRDTYFIGVYVNQIKQVAEGIWKNLSCKGGYLAPPRDIDAALCNISLKLNSGHLLVSPELAGVIQADIQRTKLDDIPLGIASLVQISEHWGMVKRGDTHQQQSGFSIRIY
jgi:hypothetical protein